MLWGHPWETFGELWQAALGVAFETFVALWAWWVALGRTWKVSREFLGSFFTLLIICIRLSMIFWLASAKIAPLPWLGWVGEGVGGGDEALHMVARALHVLCKVSLLPVLASTFA